MFKKDIDEVKRLHEKYKFLPPVLDAGGQERPFIANYEISMAKALKITLEDGRTAILPHKEQGDRYENIVRPFSFIDNDYLILNPSDGGPFIESLPEKYSLHFGTVIMVSVFEHVNNPYEVSDALFKIIKPGGYLFNSTVFIFPHHPCPEDNWRFSAKCLRNIHERSGFEYIEGGFHINISAYEGVGGQSQTEAVPHAVQASYALCRRPAQ